MDSKDWVKVYKAKSLSVDPPWLYQVNVDKSSVWIRKDNIEMIVTIQVQEANESSVAFPKPTPVFIDNKGRFSVPAAFFDEHPDDRGDFEQRVLGPLFFDK